MDTLSSFLSGLNNLSPLAVIALLGVVIFMLVKGKTAVDTKVEQVADNHLHTVTETQLQILETLQRIELTLAKNFAAILERHIGAEIRLSDAFARIRTSLNDRTD